MYWLGSAFRVSSPMITRTDGKVASHLAVLRASGIRLAPLLI
jgi:hypothetical protein